MVQLLIDRKADLSAMDAHGRVGREVAAAAGRRAVVALIDAHDAALRTAVAEKERRQREQAKAYATLSRLLQVALRTQPQLHHLASSSSLL